MKLLKGVGFSNGCAEFALKKPPPLVPNCLIAICEAAGPIGKVCMVTFDSCVTSLPAASLTGLPAASFTVSVMLVTCATGTSTYDLKFCTTPCEVSSKAISSENGTST